MEKLKRFKQKLATQQGKALTKLISLVLVTVILLGVAAWAWFASQRKADADGLNVTLGTSKNLEISLDGGASYHFGLDLLSEEDQQYIGEGNKIKDKLNMLDITSDGKTFFRPEFTQADSIRTPNCTKTWSTPNKNSAYISQTVYFRTTFPANIYLGADTKITTSCEQQGKSLVGVDSLNKSEGYNFSKDSIVGALRISAVDKDQNLLFTSIPRSDVELVKNDGTYAVNTGTAVSANSKKHVYYASDYLTKKATTTMTNVVTAFTATPESVGGSNTWLAETFFNPNTGYYEGSVAVNIWLEGCDAETLRVLSGGKYNINLDFVAIEIAEGN